MTGQVTKEPAQAWITTFAGTAINLCLGILYAWSIWKSSLVNVDKAGQVIQEGMNAGWTYLTNAQAATPFSLCIIIFALLMIPGGRIQDKFGPKVGATVGGLFLAAGCIVAGLMKSYAGLVFGFGILGGIGMGIGYASPTPAALKWFGPHKRGLVAGLVVGGYGGAALYIGPLAQYLIDHYGITGSFVGLGILFAVVVIIAGQLLRTPPEGYVPPSPPGAISKHVAAATKHNWNASEMVKTWQFFALVFMFMLTTQSGLLIIANAKGLMVQAGKNIPFLAANAWILVSFGGFVNAAGRVGTGSYSDKIGRVNAYTINCTISALCLFALPFVIAMQNVLLLFLVVGIAYWQYGGGLALLPSFTADFYGPKNLGFNYGLVFLGWGAGFFMARLGGTIEDITGSLNTAFYISGALLIAGVILARITTRPKYAGEE
ncbi:MAG: MFS transporter [Deltaproteobacteria bacterium]|uniref:MFS transporter n=1 Tax=Candidatus Methanogaster sp. TaxID=3386292 RepID=A0AC61KZL4_9EURY|nr:MAG: MFS transporter [ANME-2 cluster archaeon]PXF60185.1 MAG: MFS transporter [Deltaproteobacteria bacterium]